MAGKTVYFGTRDYADWVPAFDSEPSYSSSGYSQSTEFLNGGRASRRSVSTAKGYELTWSLNKSDELRVIADFRAGLFGQGLIHWLDPMAMASNILPQHFASPFQQGYDAPPVRGAAVTLAATEATTLRYPVETAIFETSTLAREIYVPIPPNYTAWVGVHGPASGGSITVKTTTSATNASTAAAIPKLSVTNTTRFSTSYSGNTYKGLLFGVESGAQYSGAMCQILPAGVTPGIGNFISGQGHSGCDFDGDIMETPYSSALGLIGMSATLIEVGAWL